MISRRDLLVGAAAAGASIALANAAQAIAEPTPPTYSVKPLPFDPSKLKGISEKLITLHHDKNYAGAVKRISAIEERIRALPSDTPPFTMGSLKREHLIAMNSMILHELYFGNLGGDGKPSGHVEKLMNESFGNADAWMHDFKMTGMSLSGGSGWVILSYSPHDKRLYNVWSSDHTQTPAVGVPVLVMDMYEHAYQMDHGPDAKAYIEAFFSNINWEEVDKRAAGIA
jgi:superoxide dismutase, Fe-Mn family